MNMQNNVYLIQLFSKPDDRSAASPLAVISWNVKFTNFWEFCKIPKKAELPEKFKLPDKRGFELTENKKSRELPAPPANPNS